MSTIQKEPGIIISHQQLPATQPHSSTREKLMQVMTEKLGLDQTQLQPDVSFTEDLCIDSLDIFELIIEVENVFQINIPSEEAEKLTTPGKLAAYINSNNHEV